MSFGLNTDTATSYIDNYVNKVESTITKGNGDTVNAGQNLEADYVAYQSGQGGITLQTLQAAYQAFQNQVEHATYNGQHTATSETGVAMHDLEDALPPSEEVDSSFNHGLADDVSNFISELKNSPQGTQEIKDDAVKLAQEAYVAGDKSLATDAQNIAQSVQNNTYSQQGSIDRLTGDNQDVGNEVYGGRGPLPERQEG